MSGGGTNNGWTTDQIQQTTTNDSLQPPRQHRPSTSAKGISSVSEPSALSSHSSSGSGLRTASVAPVVHSPSSGPISSPISRNVVPSSSPRRSTEATQPSPRELKRVTSKEGKTKTIQVGSRENQSQGIESQEMARGERQPVSGNPVVVAAAGSPNNRGVGPQPVAPQAAAAAGGDRAADRTFSVKNGKATFPDDPTTHKQPAYVKASNCVITSKYTLISFLPLNLFEQFSNLANLYFLLVGIFQIVPQFSTTGGNPTMYQPLAFIVFVSACRAAKEDWDKHKADKKRNGFKYHVLDGNELVEKESGDIKVGDIVKVMQNNMIPADMLFLTSALAKGHCFIDKSNLNGETTLEVMNSMVQTRAICKEEKQISSALALTLTYEPPNKRFDSFRGNMHLQTPDGPVEYNVDGKALIMRETNLRNCDWIYGLVVYTGNDTKIQRSNLEGAKPKTKVSYIMRQVNTYLVYMLLLQSVLCLIGGILAGAFREGFTAHMWFLQFDQIPGERAPTGPATGVFAFFSWFILLSQMVPISLIVSSEMVKFIQSIFIEKDIQLYYEKLNKPAKCNSSTIHEDLGLIDFIFSDKTGTLTQNKMEFRYVYLSIGDFGSKQTDIAKSVQIRQQQLADKLAGRPVTNSAVPWTQLVKPHLAVKDPRIDTQNCCTTGCFAENCWSSPSHADEAQDGELTMVKNEFTDEEREKLWKRLYGPPPQGETPEQTQNARTILRRYMTHMALSNTVKPYEDQGEMKFQAESAEELAMANFSRKCGFFKKQLNPTVLEITEYDENLKPKPEKVIETYNHVGTFGFTSKRARVTVIYQRVDGDKKCYVMMKGQDTVALPLITLGDVDEDVLLEELKNMSTFGLRTLVCGYAELDASWWSQRAAQYQEIIQRDATPASEGHPEKCKKGQCEKCAQHEFFEQTEKDAQLKYCGTIGLEDQLQLLVPECIGDCILGGIKVWMITGDKLETAKNIGLACNLIDPDMIPSFASGDIEECVKEFQRTRLVEITGAWSNMTQNDEDLGKIFDVFDKNNNGTLNLDELQYILTSLRCNLSIDKLKAIVAENSPHSQSSGAEPSIDRESFMAMMKSTQMSKFDAVWFDISEGIKTFNSIANHDQYPVSLLIDRAAFQVLFPGKAGGTPSASDLASLGPDVTLKKLNQLREMFFQIAGRAKSVVFARAEPAMKKRMVTEIQARVKGAITLAIGDGANDTDMILAAHIGVGIAGVEGTAATNSADYAIGTFRMLHQLLFVHGFYSYQRTAKLVNFIFYKASLVAVMMFLFGFFSAMSGQQFFSDPPYQLYNVMYTALPIMVVAIFDKMLPAEFLQNNPTLYQRQKHTAFDPLIFSGWIFRSFLHAVVIFFIPYASFGIQNINQSDGRADGIWFFATTCYYCTVMTPTLLILFDMSNITFLSWMALASSVSSLFVVTWIMNYLTTIVPDLDGVINTMYSSASFWLVLIVTVGISLVLELIWRAAMRELYPTVVQIYQEINRLNKEDQKVALDPVRLQPPPPPAGSPGAQAAEDAENINIEYSQSVAGGTGGDRSLENRSRRNSASQLGQGGRGGGAESARGRDKLKNNMVRAMLRFRNMTGAQFDSAAQAQFQNHDKFRAYDENGKEIVSPTNGGNASNGSSSSPRGNSNGINAEPVTHYVINQGSQHNLNAGEDFKNTASSSSNSINVSLQLLDKYGGQQQDESKTQSSPKFSSAGSGREADGEEPKTHDRRLL